MRRVWAAYPRRCSSRSLCLPLNPALCFAHHLNERGGGSRLELGSGALLDVREDAFGFPGVAIRAAGTQRIIDVADVHQIAGLVALSMVMTGRVAVTVDHDVML